MESCSGDHHGHSLAARAPFPSMAGLAISSAKRHRRKSNPFIALLLAVCMVLLLMALVLAVLAVALPRITFEESAEEAAEEEELSLEEQRIQRYSLSPSIRPDKMKQLEFRNFCFYSVAREKDSCVPRTIILGGEQANARGLLKSLKRHPRLNGAQVRDVDFYGDTETWLRGMEFYGWKYHHPESVLLGTEAQQLIDTSPSYLGAPYVAERVYSLLHESAKFIVVLRDPVMRALAHIRHQHSLDTRQHDTFMYPTYIERFNTTDADFLAEELQCLQRCAPPIPNQWAADNDEEFEIVGQRSKENRVNMSPPPGSKVPEVGFGILDRCPDCAAYPLKSPHMVGPGGFLAKGLYAELLEPYMNYFGLENFHFIRYEDLLQSKQRTAELLNEVCDFLEVPVLKLVEWDEDEATEVADHETVRDEDIGDVDPSTLQWLRDFYTVPNQELADLIGHRFRW